MKILVLNYEYPPLGGGAAPMCRQLSERYARAGHSVDVVTMAYRSLPREERQDGVRITRVPALRSKVETCETPEMLSYVLSALPRVWYRLRPRAYDIIHCHFIIPTGLVAWGATRFGRTPYVLTAHGSDVPGFNRDRFTWEHRFTGPLLRAVTAGAAAVVVPSLYLGELVRRSVGVTDIRHIPNGIDTARLACGPKKQRILLTGRLLPRKGMRHVLQSLAGIESGYEIHIAGDGPQLDDLRATARRLTMKVVFHGWLSHDSPELRELYESAAIYCLVSERENASISLLEGMLSGAAVLTSNGSGCAETIGDAGFTVEHGDVSAIRDTLLQLMKSPALCHEYGQKARKRVLEEFDWGPIAGRYLEVLNEVVEKSHAEKRTDNRPSR